MVNDVQASSKLNPCGICHEEQQDSKLFNLCDNEHKGNCSLCISNWYKAQDLRQCTNCRTELSPEKIKDYNERVTDDHQIPVVVSRISQARRSAINESDAIRPNFTGFNGDLNPVFEE